MSEESETLRLCPFCGARAHMTALQAEDYTGENGWASYDSRYGVECDEGCVHVASFDSRAEAIAAWNRRALSEEAGETRAEWVAERFHEIYERLAPAFSYETRRESAVPWADVPEENRALMVATARELLVQLASRSSVEPPREEAGDDEPPKVLRNRMAALLLAIKHDAEWWADPLNNRPRKFAAYSAEAATLLSELMSKSRQREVEAMLTHSTLAARSSSGTPAERPSYLVVNGCPCRLVTPCSINCSCADPLQSGGCERCAAYGSMEQRRSTAERLAGTPGTLSEGPTLAEEYWCGCTRHAAWNRCDAHQDFEHDEEPPLQSLSQGNTP